MKPCPKCGEIVKDQDKFCENCGTTLPATIDESGMRTYSNPFAALVPPQNKKAATYVSTYHTHRIIAQVVSFFGWAAVVIVVLASLVFSAGFGVYVIPLAILGIIFGLGLVAAGQLMRAVSDTAAHTGEMLAIMRRDRNEKT